MSCCDVVRDMLVRPASLGGGDVRYETGICFPGTVAACSLLCGNGGSDAIVFGAFVPY